MDDMKKDENLEKKEGAGEAQTEETVETVQVTDNTESESNSEATQESPEQEVQEEEEKAPKVTLGAKIKESFHNRKFKNGAYATTVSVIVVVIVLIVNIFLSKLDWKVDLSSTQLFTLTNATKEYVKGLTDDITIYYLVQAGDEYDYYVNLAEKYDSLSDHITLEYKDPVLYPKFASDYTDADVNENSVIVVNHTNGRYKYIDCNDLRQTQMDQSTYQTYVSAIDFEGQVTSALQYVTTEDLPVFYQVTGHGETELGTACSDLLTKQNVDLQSLTTMKTEKIPEDCKVLIVNAPKNDYSEQEVNMIKDYLVNGGKAIFFTDYYTNDCPNFVSLLNYYGVEIVDGYVMEGDYDHMAFQYPPYVIPDVNTDAALLANFTNTSSFVVSPFSVGIKALDTVRSSITMESLLTTSDKSYSKQDVETKTFSKVDGDIDGPFDIAMAIKETYNGVETNLIVLGCPVLPDDSVLTNASYADYDLLATIVNAVSGTDSQAISVAAKPLSFSQLSLTSSQQNFWFYMVLIVIPVCIMITGGVIVARRRRK